MIVEKIDTLELSKKGWLIVGKKDSGKLQCKRCRKVQTVPLENYSDGQFPEPCKCRCFRREAYVLITF